MSRPVTASRTPRCLRQQRKGTFRRSVIRQMQRTVRRQHSHQRYIRNIVSLCHHLRANQHIGRTTCKTPQNIGMRKLRHSRILIHAQHTHLRQLLQLFFSLLRTTAEILDAAAMAVRALLRQRHRVTAVMAAQILVLLMVNHCYGAMRTGNRLAAVTAHHKGRIATAVQEDNRLLPRRRRHHQRLLQRARQHAEIARLQFLAHIHDLNLWQSSTIRT